MLYFVTGNQDKLVNANVVLKGYGMQVTGKDVPITEIQSDSLEEIAVDKARQAFEKVKKPLVVKDDGWYITVLRGFPGVYMKYVNQWFTPQDFLNILKPHDNREVIFKEAVCYIDDKQTKFFLHEINGQILKNPRGQGRSIDQIATFRKDEKTMAECWAEHVHFMEPNESVWHGFAKWYKENYPSF